jgi:hypothetical protein
MEPRMRFMPSIPVEIFHMYRGRKYYKLKDIQK